MDRNRLTRTTTDRHRKKGTETDRNGLKQTEMKRNGQKKISKQTEIILNENTFYIDLFQRDALNKKKYFFTVARDI